MEKRSFFEVMKEAINDIAPGLQNMVPEIGAELSRLRTQGTMELASAAFRQWRFRSIWSRTIYANA